MKLLYKARGALGLERWQEIHPSVVGDHDFKGNFDFKYGSPEEGWTVIDSYEDLQKIMADYSKATPEAGEVSGDAINPSHYKQLLVITNTDGKYIDTLQWLEHLQYKPFWRNNMHAFVHAVRDLCADKYLARMGMKDDETQEMEKALWYFKFATAIMKNGYKPVRVNDIDHILAGTVPAFVAVNGLGKVLIQEDNTCFLYNRDEAYLAAGPEGYVISSSRPKT